MSQSVSQNVLLITVEISILTAYFHLPPSGASFGAIVAPCGSVCILIHIVMIVVDIMG